MNRSSYTHVTVDQGLAMMKSLLKRDPAAREIIQQSFKGKMAELVHH